MGIELLSEEKIKKKEDKESVKSIKINTNATLKKYLLAA